MKGKYRLEFGFFLMFVILSLTGCGLADKDMATTKERDIVKIAESLAEEGTFEAGDIYVDSILYGNYSQAEEPELLALCKFKNNVHVAGIDRTLAIVFREDSMEVVAYKEFGYDEVVLHLLPTEAESRILFIGRTAYQDISEQYLLLYCVEENEWNECPIEGVEIQENDLCYITDDNKLFVVPQENGEYPTEMISVWEKQVVYEWDRNQVRFVNTVSEVVAGDVVYNEVAELSDDETLELIEDSFYDKDKYGYIDAKEQSYTNFEGQECGYADFDCYYFTDDTNPNKFDLVNQTLQKLYDETAAEYQSYCEDYLYDYEAEDDSVSFYLYLVSIPYVGEDYVSLIFNDIVSYAGAAHPATYFVPVTISVETGELVTPEEVLGKSWPEIRATVGMNEQNEEEFMKEYGFYLTDHTLTYKYRTNVFVEEIVIKR